MGWIFFIIIAIVTFKLMSIAGNLARKKDVDWKNLSPEDYRKESIEEEKRYWSIFLVFVIILSVLVGVLVDAVLY